MLESFQSRVREWVLACFGEQIANDKQERNHRFLEESLELVQAAGCTKAEAQQMLDYVYGREKGEVSQECGGVLITLASLCHVHQVDMQECGEVELERIWTCIDKVRAKQEQKPKPTERG